MLPGQALTGDNSFELYGYDGFNRMVSANMSGAVTTYAYRPDGLRHSKTTGGVTTTHIWDGSNIALDISGSSVVKYVRGINLICSDFGHYLYNGHGDVVNLTSAAGAVTKTYDYDAFGVERNLSAADANPWRYCGEYLDLETNTYYLRARNYQPTTGRFLSEDTVRARRMNIFDPYGYYQDVEMSGGVFRDGKTGRYIVDDPLSLNLYTYAQNNPIRFQDPGGHLITPANIIGGLIGAGLGAIIGLAIANHYGLTGWARGIAIGGGSLLVGVAGWFAGPAIVGVATKAIAGAITAGTLMLDKIPGWITSALNLGQHFAQKAAANLAGSAEMIKHLTKHLQSAGGTYAKFLTDSALDLNNLLSRGLNSATDFVVNSPDSFSTIVNMGQAVGTKGEQFIKIVFTVGGKIITAFPVK